MIPYYSREGIVILHGDCRDVLPTLEQVDHVITDPPYSEHVHSKQWIGHALTAGDKRTSTAFKELGFDSLTAEMRLFFLGQVGRVCSRWMLAFTDLESVALWQADIITRDLDYVRAAIWDKVDSAPQFTGDRPANSAEAIVIAHPKGKKRWNGGGRRNVFRHEVNGARGPKPHPSTKPLPLMLELVRLFTDPGDVILDPFAGSGTTGIAAFQLHRKAILIELEEKWCEVAAKRLEAETPPLPLYEAEQSSQEVFAL